MMIKFRIEINETTGKGKIFKDESFFIRLGKIIWIIDGITGKRCRFKPSKYVSYFVAWEDAWLFLWNKVSNQMGLDEDRLGDLWDEAEETGRNALQLVEGAM